MMHDRIIFKKGHKTTTRTKIRKAYKETFFYFIHQENVKLNQQVPEKLIEKYLLFYQQNQRVLLNQDLETAKLMKFFMVNTTYG